VTGVLVVSRVPSSMGPVIRTVPRVVRVLELEHTLLGNGGSGVPGSVACVFVFPVLVVVHRPFEHPSRRDPSHAVRVQIRAELAGNVPCRCRNTW
jgi:hypothetical protein